MIREWRGRKYPGVSVRTGGTSSGGDQIARIPVVSTSGGHAVDVEVRRPDHNSSRTYRRPDARLDSLPGLILSVRRMLRRHLNDEHIARASALGVPSVDDTAGIACLVREGRLVRLPDSTRYWMVRELDQSLPYVTPEKLTALEELGERFHARLAEAGLPPFRFEISSALRTSALQEDLRARNPNASRKQSSHEFGTTVDIAYNEFAPPSADAWAPWRDAVTGDGDAEELLRARLDAIANMRLDSLGNTYSDHLKGELGTVLQRMQAEGRMWPLYERSQPVFHTTLAGPRRGTM